jgi:hypothetical protein
MRTKICGGCKEEKLVAEFHKKASANDGLNSWCKVCKNLAYKKRLSEGVYENYRKKNPVKKSCHSKLGWAVRSGKIIRSTECENCDRSGYVEAHHEDYSKPLDVIWLCRSCHFTRHGEWKKEGKTGYENVQMELIK